MKRPFSIIPLLIALSTLLAPNAVVRAGGNSGPGAIESASEREITRRQEDLVVAEQLIAAGDAARSRKEVEQAYQYYKQAVDMVPQGSAAGALRSKAVARFSSASVLDADYLVSRGKYADARRVASEVLEARYNPDYRPAIVFLSHLEEADYFNKVITPEFAEQRDEVNSLINEAVGFYDSGRFDKAANRYRRVLAIDKENAAALRGLEQVELAKQRYYEAAYNDTRSRMLWQVDRAWARPVPTAEAVAVTQDLGAMENERAGTERMIARLSGITIDQVGPFKDATIQQVVEWFRRQSRELSTNDGEPPINITLQLPTTSQVSTPDTETGEAPTAQSSAPNLVTLDMKDVPFYEALRYAATIANMKVRVDPYAVSVIPANESSEAMTVREFKVPPDFLSRSAEETEAEPEAFAGRGGDEAYDTRLKLSGRLNAEDFLRQKGVEFPPGATASLAPGSTRLVVKNTASAVEFIEAIVEAATLEQPTQVEIDAKFVEISQNNLKELGFDWTLGPFSIGGSGVYGGGGNSAASGRNFPFIYPGTSTPVGVDTATGGLRTGSGSLPYSAVTVNSLNAILAGQQLGQAGGPAPGILSLAGIFTNPQFQVLSRALNQKKGVDLMAAPKVTAKSGQRAKINISRTFPYPQEFEPPQIPQDTGGSQLSVGGGGIPSTISSDTSDPIVTPSFPTDFTTRDLGVILEVEPQVGADGYTIELSLSPEVVDFDGFINYGSPIYVPPPSSTLGAVANATSLGLVSIGERQLLTDNVINQPIFSTRKVTTNVSIWDGQTVALGGLIREDIQKVSDKVPVLGDIPLAGVLFRSEVEQKIKRNLVIFVTARLIDAYGQPLRPEDDTDQEELVAPLGLPPEIPLPSRSNPKGGLTRK